VGIDHAARSADGPSTTTPDRCDGGGIDVVPHRGIGEAIAQLREGAQPGDVPGPIEERTVDGLAEGGLDRRDVGIEERVVFFREPIVGGI